MMEEALLRGPLLGLTNRILETARPFFSSGDRRRDNILLACHPRGGSTWLAEILSHLPHHRIVWEPFHPGNNHLAGQSNLHPINHLTNSTISSVQEQYVTDVLKGDAMCTGFLFGNPPSLQDCVATVTAPALIFKCTCANLMLPLLYQMVPLPTIVLLRHPCAVVSSQLNHPAWDAFNPCGETVQSTLSSLLDDRPEWTPVWESLSTTEEYLAFLWGARTALPLQASYTSDWCLVTYEHLVSDASATVHRIFEYLEAPVPPAALEQIDVPSTTTEPDSNVVRDGSPLRTWQRRLSDAQVDRILSTVHRMGVHFYDRSLDPDMSVLSSYIGVRT
jgi:hypothetical protein